MLEEASSAEIQGKPMYVCYQNVTVGCGMVRENHASSRYHSPVVCHAKKSDAKKY